MSAYTRRSNCALLLLLQTLHMGCVAGALSFQETGLIPLEQPTGVILKLRPSRDGDGRVQAAAGFTELLTSSQGAILLQKLAPGASVQQTLDQLTARQGALGRRRACGPWQRSDDAAHPTGADLQNK